MTTPFDIIKARIAQSLLPDGYEVVIKGEQTISVPEVTEPQLPDNALMARLDQIADRMGDIEDRFSKGEHTVKDEMEYARLDREYKAIHVEYKKRHAI